MTMLRVRPVAPRSASAISAITPPAPSFDARITNSTYLTVTTMTRLQKNSDSTPSTFCSVSFRPIDEANAAWNAYSGEVPMSPKTTPSAASDSTGSEAVLGDPIARGAACAVVVVDAKVEAPGTAEESAAPNSTVG